MAISLYITWWSRMQAHDPDGKAGLGDLIEIDACRPYSKTKRFSVGKIVKAFDLIVDEETGEVATLGDSLSTSVMSMHRVLPNRSSCPGAYTCCSVFANIGP